MKYLRIRDIVIIRMLTITNKKIYSHKISLLFFSVPVIRGNNRLGYIKVYRT